MGARNEPLEPGDLVQVGKGYAGGQFRIKCRGTGTLTPRDAYFPHPLLPLHRIAPRAVCPNGARIHVLIPLGGPSSILSTAPFRERH